MTPADLAAKGLRVDSLRALYGAVKAGEFPGDVTARDLGLPDGEIAILTFYEAFSGSLDAALALHNAVLPDWYLSEISEAPDHGDYPGKHWSVVIAPRNGPGNEEAAAATPARAMLLAILAAMIEQEEEG
jgi:hypothetical protein